MRNPRHLFSSLIVSLALTLPATAQTSHWLTGYYATYNYGVMSTSQLDYTKLTHVIYWPVIPSSSSPGTLNTTPFGLSATTFANGATDLVTRAHAAGAKALIGIGGDQSSGATAGFQIATTSKYQATFIKNIVSLMQQYGFDGVDINWEQIQNSDNSDFTSFIANLRAALTTASPNVHLLLTMPPETKPNGGRPDLLVQVYQDLDQINIQTYQMSGPYCGWETWYNSPLNNGGATFILNTSEQLPSITNAIADYTSVGIPQSKLAMGIQFDSEIWTGGQGTSTGGVTEPKQTWTGDGNSAYCSTTNPAAPTINTLAYRLMITNLTAAQGYTTNFDSTADQSWLSHTASSQSNDAFVSFDSPTSIAKKGVDMSPSAGAGGALGGVFIFELSGDFAATAPAAQQHPLLNAAHGMQMLLPGLVTNLKATAATASATLTWTAANGATSYNVLYSTSATGTTTSAPAVTGTSTTVTKLTPGQEYWFQVQPVNTFGSGVKTAQVTAIIPGSTLPTVTWATPAAIPYGTPLSATQLDATASVAGTFVYTPAKGTVPAAGSDTLSVTFTPSSPNYSAVTKTVTQVVTANTLTTSPSFAATNVGSESNAQAITVTLSTAGTISSIQVLTMGAAGLDFANANGGTCAVGKTYAAGGACSVNVTFAPTTAGTRAGAVVIQTASGPATTYITGTGVAPQVTFDPGIFSTIAGPATISPNSIAVDGNGNVYYSDGNSNNVFKVTPAGTYSVYYSGQSSMPGELAMDGAGNLYIGLQSSTGAPSIVKLTPAGVASTFYTGFTYGVFSLGVDPSTGSVFATDTGVIKITPAGLGSTFVAGYGTILGEVFDYPSGVAVDGSGNVYVSDTFNSRILKFDSSGAHPSLVPSSGLSYPRGIALSGTGNLYIADESTDSVVKITPGGVQSNVVTGTVLGETFGEPYSVAVDGAENVYVSDWTNKRFLKANRQTPAGLSFANASVGSISYDSPKGFTVESNGNAALTFNPPASGTNAAITTGFTFASSNNCPVLTPTSAAVSLAPGASCNVSINFQPTSNGVFSGDVTLTDNPLSIAGSQQMAPLSATGAASTKATVTLSGLSTTYSSYPQSVTATTSPSGLAVSITYNGSTTAPTKAGSYAVVATVTTAGYVGSATGTLVIAKVTPSIHWAAPSLITYGTPLSSTQLRAVEFGPWTGTFVYSPAAGTIEPVGTDTLTTTFEPTDPADVNAVTTSVSLVVNPATNSRVVWIPDFYGSLLQVRVGATPGTTPTAITINLPSCNPNAVAVNNNKAYVVCNAYGGNPDKILVYNATTIRAAPAGTLSISPLQTITSSQFNSLIGISFDSSNNLWVASYGNNQVDSISAATLSTANPVVTPSLINSPGSPVSLAFDGAGGMWVVGQFAQGILLHFPVSQINAGANANPDYCLAATSLSGCQYVSNVFLSPEGVALYGGDVWVSNNSTGATGTVPGRELVDLKFSGGTLTVNATFGASGTPSSAPFVCPGGLYASSSHLWVNDESYGEANPACGANGDVASQTGGVFSFTPAELAAKTTTISQVLAFSNITGRPGFGGIFVEND